MVDDIWAQPDRSIWDPGIEHPNEHLQRLILLSAVTVAGARNPNHHSQSLSTPRTELDSHANMSVVGNNAVVVNDSGKTVEVNSFTPDYKAKTVRILDAVVRYDCLF